MPTVFRPQACILIGILGGVLFTTSLSAEEPLPQVERLQSSPVLRHLLPNPPSPAANQAASPAAEILRQMYVAPGFRADLIAAEPEVRQPIAFAWDDRGRLWIAEAHSYPSRRPEGQGLDRLVILEDSDQDGHFETRKVFTEGLNLVSGFEIGHGGVWVGAAPELLFIADRDGDDRPDGPPVVLLDGFGYQDTHECLNSFLWGPDGWLYGIQGVFNLAHIGKPGSADDQRQELRAGVWRYHPTRHQFEIFAHGGSNPWGLDYDSQGQLFMTHCRSYWGKGGTTHVIQGGHFWNQANANYAPFIVADPPAAFPGFRNYLLASARYDHGAGGAGLPGSDAIYGGHSHVGTMIYQGDNWPEEFRGRLFTHNLHGHQINQQVNRPWGSGFDTVHAGRDHFFCTDPKYVAIDLQYGPDGAVYFIDWYDQQHCHNPNDDRWERGSGRVYRLQWAATYRPVRVNLGTQSDAELVQLHRHRNEWFVRMARRLLQERAASGQLHPQTRSSLTTLAFESLDPALRLRALWTLHQVGGGDESALRRGLEDPDPYMRGWSILLAADPPPLPIGLAPELIRLAKTDPSPVVRRHLASVLPRLPTEVAWLVIEELARHGEDAEDRNIPALLWHGLAPRMPDHLDRALAVAATTPIPALADWIHWYAATLEGEALNRAVTALQGLDDPTLHRRLAGLWLAMERRANVPMPLAWPQQASHLYAHPHPQIRRWAERLAAAFGDATLFPNLRSVLANTGADTADRQHAFAVLSRAQDRESLPLFLQLLQEPAFRAPVLPLLARFDDPRIPSTLVGTWNQWTPAERAGALQTLTSRPAYALALLHAVQDQVIPRDHLSAFHIRQMTALRDAAVDAQLAQTWGKLQPTAEEKRELIESMEKTFSDAPLWAYDAGAGRRHFQNLCASCHVLGSDGVRVGPELTGAGRNGIRYYLESIIDPNAVIGTDFQVSTFDLASGDVVSGLVLQETSSAVTVRTTTEEQVLAKSAIEDRQQSELSLMPEGLLEALGPRERIELLKYLIEH